MRTRLLLALVATSAVTLLAAATALLSPLQDRLRDQSRDSLQAAVQSARGQLVTGLRDGRPNPYFLAGQLGSRTNADVTIYDFGPNGLTNQPLGDDRIDDVWRVYAATRRETIADPGGAGIRIAVPLLTRNHHTYILAVRKQDTALTQVVREVRRAFLTAALIGLGAALVLGLVLSATLSRRLGRLRQTAQRIVREGPDAPAPQDERRDEVGDLARAMAEMQQALRRQERARRHFVSTASHELRTPLTSLMGTLELLAEDLDSPDFDVADAKAQVDAARGDLQRLRVLAAELLDLSRLDAGVELRGEPVELGELTRAVAAEFALQAAAAEQTLTVMPPPGPCWAHGDPDAVARITRILIDNALRYAPGAAITVATNYAGTQALLSVADDGPGVAPSDRELIFERFRRGGHTGAAAGFGLGLAIGRELATRLDGTLELDAAHPGGARFVLKLAIEMPSGDQDATSASGSRIEGVSGAAR